MKRFISVILAITILLSVNVCCMASNDVLISDLLEIDDLSEYSVSTIKTPLTSIAKNDLAQTDIEHILNFLNNNKLTCTNTKLGSNTNYKDMGYSFVYTVTFSLPNLTYEFRIAEEYIIAISIDGTNRTFRHGEFKFKNTNDYNSLSKLIDTMAEKKKAQNEIEKEENLKKHNALNISNLDILYSATFDIDNYKDVNWGICSYTIDGETTPVTKVFYGLINQASIKEHKILVVNGSVNSKTNTVNFNLTSNPGRTVIVDNTISEMYEQDTDDGTFVVDFSIQINVTPSMDLEKVTATYFNRYNDSTKTLDININDIVEDGKIPEGFFSSENNVNYEKEPEKTEVETPKEETPAKPETEEKQETVVEDKPEVEPEKEEVKPEEEKSTTEDKKENTADAEKSDDTDTDLKEETKPLFFSDVSENHWAYDEIYDFAKRKIVLGYGNGLFGVDDSITYEHFALLLERQLNYNETNRQNSPAIREDVIVSIVKALKIDVSSAKEGIIDNTFTDCRNLKPENRKYIAAAIEKGLVIGSDAKLCPYDNLTRAETVILLSRAEKYK